MRGWVLFPFLGGCFYDVPPLSEALDDAGIDAPMDAAQSCITKGSACTSSLAKGWTPLALKSSPNATCPAGFTTIDLVGSPVAQSGVCACGCMIVKQPSCSVGAISLMNGPNNACTNGPFNYTITSEGQCVDFGGTFNESAYHKWSILPLTPGTCSTTAAVADTSKIATSPVHTCVPEADCAEDVCSGLAPSGTQACIIHDDDVPCPMGPFAQKHLAGMSPTGACGACSTCSVNTVCGAATVRDYGDAQCTQLKDTENLGNVCAVTGMAAGINHFKYDATAQTTCAPGTSTAIVDLAAKQTICCR